MVLCFYLNMMDFQVWVPVHMQFFKSRPGGNPHFFKHCKHRPQELVPAVFKCGVVDSIAISSSLRAWTLAFAQNSGIHVAAEWVVSVVCCFRVLNGLNIPGQ